MHETLALKANHRRCFFRFSSENRHWPEEVNTGGEKGSRPEIGWYFGKEKSEVLWMGGWSD